jgi:hypothetical protein
MPDKYSSEGLIRKHFSQELLGWLESMDIYIAEARAINLFPSTTVPILVQADFCTIGSSAKLLIICPEDATILYNKYAIKDGIEVSVDNYESLLSNPGDIEETKFSVLPKGWNISPDAVTLDSSTELVSGDTYILETGTPHTITCRDDCRTRYLELSIYDRNTFVPPVHGISYIAAKDLLCTPKT